MDPHKQIRRTGLLGPPKSSWGLRLLLRGGKGKGWKLGNRCECELMWTFRVEGRVVLGGDEGEDEDKYGGYEDVNNSRVWRK